MSAPTTPVSCVFAPAASATGVFAAFDRRNLVTPDLALALSRVQATDVRRMGNEIIPSGDYTVLIADPPYALPNAEVAGWLVAAADNAIDTAPVPGRSSVAPRLVIGALAIALAAGGGRCF